MSDTQDQSGAVQAGGSPGAILRQARERAGLHIGALSVSLKVPVKRLEALEADRFDMLPGPVFVRALALSVCRQLKLDPQAVLALLPDAGQPVLGVEGSMSEPFRSPSHRGPVRSVLAVSKPALLTAFVLGLAAAMVFFWPEIASWSGQNAATKAAPAAPSVITEQVQPVPPPQKAAELASAPVAAQPAPSLPPSAAPLESQPSKPVESAIVLFKAHKTTWVEVIGPGGEVVLRRLIEAGEQVPVTAAPLLRVTVGNVGGVTVLVRGSPFDLSPIAQGNTARFEVQ
jgi:cytoskeleton protein RodZ